MHLFVAGARNLPFSIINYCFATQAKIKRTRYLRSSSGKFDTFAQGSDHTDSDFHVTDKRQQSSFS